MRARRDNSIEVEVRLRRPVLRRRSTACRRRDSETATSSTTRPTTSTPPSTPGSASTFHESSSPAGTAPPGSPCSTTRPTANDDLDLYVFDRRRQLRRRQRIGDLGRVGQRRRPGTGHRTRGRARLGRPTAPTPTTPLRLVDPVRRRRRRRHAHRRARPAPPPRHDGHRRVQLDRLAADTRYLGALSHGDGTTVLALTLVSVTTLSDERDRGVTGGLGERLLESTVQNVAGCRARGNRSLGDGAQHCEGHTRDHDQRGSAERHGRSLRDIRRQHPGGFHRVRRRRGRRVDRDHAAHRDRSSLTRSRSSRSAGPGALDDLALAASGSRPSVRSSPASSPNTTTTTTCSSADPYHTGSIRRHGWPVRPQRARRCRSTIP